MWRHFRCGEILDVEKFYLWRNLGCGEICLISCIVSSGMSTCQVKLIDNMILPWDNFLMEFTLFCRKICFAAIYAVLSQNLFCRETCFVAKPVLSRFTHFLFGETCFVAVYALFVWRQHTAKMLSVEKKWQISCMRQIAPNKSLWLTLTHIQQKFSGSFTFLDGYLREANVGRDYLYGTGPWPMGLLR